MNDIVQMNLEMEWTEGVGALLTGAINSDQAPVVMMAAVTVGLMLVIPIERTLDRITRFFTIDLAD